MLLLATAAAQSSAQHPSYLTPAEIIKLVSDSKVHYTVKSATSGEGELADPLSTLFPQAAQHIPLPMITEGEHGQRFIDEYQFDSSALKLIEEAEPLFDKEKYEQARKLYLQAIAQSPNCYLAYSHVGDTYLFSNDPDSALVYYDKAIALNSNDYQLFFYKGHALVKAGRMKEARDAYIQALTLNPRHENTYKHLRTFRDELKITLHDELFHPLAVAKRDGESILIAYDLSGGAEWLVYGMAKGMWLGEGAHRKALTGVEEREPWSSIEETECIGALLAAYLTGLDQGKTKRNAELDRLVAIAKNGFLSELLVYEFGSRVFPDVVVLQPDKFRQSMAEFIGKYVVVSND
jgi:tetratricopeptide (TPR) repeat protein